MTSSVGSSRVSRKKGTSTLSIRLLWPFLRVRSSLSNDAVLSEAALDLRALVDPDTRISHKTVMDLLALAVNRSGDPALGLRAAASLEPGDLGVLEYAARSCETVRDAIACSRRYVALLNDSIVWSLEERADLAIWRIAVVDDVEQHPCANDFLIASGVAFSQRITGRDPALVEVHFAHRQPDSVDHYRRVFSCKLKFGMPVNAIVFRRADLDQPLRLANAGLRDAYAIHAEEALRRIEHEKDTAARVRRALVVGLRTGATRLGWVARELGMSTAKLRRVLAGEGTTLSELLDEVRRDLASKYLADASLALGEVAFLLGFSNVPAFYKAFRRWYPGRTPLDVKKELQSEHGRAGRRNAPQR